MCAFGKVDHTFSNPDRAQSPAHNHRLGVTLSGVTERKKKTDPSTPTKAIKGRGPSTYAWEFSTQDLKGL